MVQWGLLTHHDNNSYSLVPPQQALDNLQHFWRRIVQQEQHWNGAADHSSNGTGTLQLPEVMEGSAVSSRRASTAAAAAAVHSAEVPALASYGADSRLCSRKHHGRRQWTGRLRLPARSIPRIRACCDSRLCLGAHLG